MNLFYKTILWVTVLLAYLPATAQELTQTVKNLELDAYSPELVGLSFDGVLAEAQQRASSAIASEFSRSPNTALKLTVSLEKKGLVVPILLVTVTGSQWQRQPDLTLWSKTLSRSGELLGYFTVPSQAVPVSRPSSSVTSVYSSGFFKINRPFNRSN